MRLYIASPFKLVAHRARPMVARVRAAGHEVVSRWHEGAGDGSAQPDHAVAWGERGELERAREMNHADLARADALVAITWEDEGRALGRETYVEIGIALALGIPVVWSVETGGVSLSHVHPLVVLARRDEHVPATLDVLASARASAGAASSWM